MRSRFREQSSAPGIPAEQIGIVSLPVLLAMPFPSPLVLQLQDSCTPGGAARAAGLFDLAVLTGLADDQTEGTEVQGKP